MAADFLRAIDWNRPWLAPYRERGLALASAENWCAAANDMAAGIVNSRGLQISFVPQPMLPEKMPYEAFIAQTGRILTRENLHDFFNALVWLTFPRVKVRLNAIQAAEIDASGALQSTRGKVRDAATLFDENAALLVVRDGSLLESLREHRWHQVFVTQRADFLANCRVVLFGHALMEKLVTPYKAITAHAWPVPVIDGLQDLPQYDQLDHLDTQVARALLGTLMPSCFTPLPILGVPGWWECQDAEFYADAAVFRPKRRTLQQR